MIESKMVEEMFDRIARLPANLGGMIFTFERRRSTDEVSVRNLETISDLTSIPKTKKILGSVIPPDCAMI